MSGENLSGSVDNQAAAGETVTITITKPDGTTTQLQAQTLADGSYAAPTYNDDPGHYSAVAHVDADALYTAADSAPFEFDIPLNARGITLTGTPA